jgi:putative FmdB family regulatory protein
MPIYEFYCERCNTIFNFFSSMIDTDKRPDCPRCQKPRLERLLSRFATLKKGKAEEGDEESPIPDVDESKLEQAMATLANEAESMNEEDPRQAAQLMRKLTDMTGLNLGPAMEEALHRMEAGEDPEQIEAEMGDLLEDEDPFAPGGGKKGYRSRKAPHQDDQLYFL